MGHAADIVHAAKRLNKFTPIAFMENLKEVGGL
jgi:hypothetical protein